MMEYLDLNLVDRHFDNPNVPRKIKGRTIWFCDIVGFSARIEVSEIETISEVTRLLKKVATEIIKQKGKVVKSTGDGNFALFDNIEGAIKAGLIVLSHVDLKDMGNLSLRIGIHRGHVFFLNNDYFGHAVNITSRLESIAPSNGIAISNSVYKKLPKYLIPRFLYIGIPPLKNISKPTPVFVYEYKFDDQKKFVKNTSVKLTFMLWFLRIFKHWQIIIIALLTILIVYVWQPRTDQSENPYLIDKCLAIQHFKQVNNDSSFVNSVRYQVASQIIEKKINVYDLDLQFAAYETDNIRLKNESKIDFFLKGELLNNSENTILSWQLTEINTRNTIGIGKMKIENGGIEGDATTPIIQAILKKAVRDYSSQPGKERGVFHKFLN